jgi:hypothetical protein
MSERTDEIIKHHLNQRPGARHAYSYDPTMHNDIERTRSLLAVVESAMQREGIPYDSAERVLNEIMRVGLDGWEQDKLSRERALLLTTFDPPEFGRLSSTVFTEPGPGAAQLTDGTPEQLAAWVEKEQARLIESTGFDLRVPPGGDNVPERPVSSEETTR